MCQTLQQYNNYTELMSTVLYLAWGGQICFSTTIGVTLAGEVEIAASSSETLLAARAS